MNILTINAGSSSIKYKAFTLRNHRPDLVLSGLIEGIGESVTRWHHRFTASESGEYQFSDHEQAFNALARKLQEDLQQYPIDGIGHRVVHGGSVLFQPTIIDDSVLDTIRQLADLAPIHNPINAQGIVFARRHYPNAVQVAIFDSGFHHTMPPHASQYAIDADTAARYRIKRYGFHGINHEYVARQAALFLKKPFHSCQFITLHLGNGASACLIKNGQSADTTMGMTPLPGLIMGTRCGDIDPAIVLYLLEQGISAGDIDQLLNKKSGLKGVAQDNDMRNLLARHDEGDSKATLAIDMYVYSVQKTIGAYLSQTGNLDALIFTGGVGENAAAIREKVLVTLKHLGFHIDKKLNEAPSEQRIHLITRQGHPVLTIKGDEEYFMAQEVAGLLQK
ncbi:acetate/propionate family kinase [Legionella spiritensis]|uniref:acetate/propionate family kinase n=1 Tax=Legionella spiritensis TaxID=452 RepID=UPI000F6F5914|nr:acetate/propionate family kinase [Legionella spiritensis]VEG90195.1 Acetate kinase (Acetokinase) [Legionella spiritensis]